MKEPIGVRVDLEVPAAYIKYSKSSSTETRDIVEGGSVAYDLDDSGEIVGIEILWLDDVANIEAARTFAGRHGLAFPRDLGGNFAAA